MNEIWKDIPEYEGMYQASNLGRVRSLDRLDSIGKRHSGKILSGYLDGHGYPTFHLWSNGTFKHAKGHHLVMLCFVGPRDEKLVVDHINADRADNKLQNLRYITQRENSSRWQIKENGLPTGVLPSGKSNRFRAMCRDAKKKRHIGTFSTAQEASIAYEYAVYNGVEKAIAKFRRPVNQ